MLIMETKMGKWPEEEFIFVKCVNHYIIIVCYLLFVAVIEKNKFEIHIVIIFYDR